MHPANKTIISVQQPKLKPQFTNIGYGNPRYNSMVVCPDDSVVISCGTTLRKVNIVSDTILYNQQVGCSQIFQIMDFQNWIMVVNFEGLISLMNKQTLQIQKQFLAHGKEIRHSSINSKFIVVSCQLNDGTQQSCIKIFSVQDILTKQGINIDVQPVYHKFGYYYYPQIHQNHLYFIQFDDPNPKGKSRTQTVMNVKLPVKHKILKLNLADLKEGIQQVYNIKTEGQILCAAQNHTTKQIFYLHQSKKITVIDLPSQKAYQIQIVASAAPHCIQAYRNGILFSSLSNQITYLEFNEKPKIQILKLNTKGLTTNYSIKAAVTNQDNFIFFNQFGLLYYDSINKKTYNKNCFDITNCGISFNKDASKFAVADFGGNVYILAVDQKNAVPKSISQISIGIPVRTLVWCHSNDTIFIGCVGGYLFNWDRLSSQAQLIQETDNHTINILRYFNDYVLFGTSDGYVFILDANTKKQLYKFQAHTPIHYQNQKQRELFGSMKNYAQIWSIITFPTLSENIFNIVTSSEDQTEKVFKITKSNTNQFHHEQIYHLKGHSLAVTSVDWKKMGKDLGTVYVSCSDDKIVRFRNPENMFQIVHQLQTSTIKQWHTLTYLALEPDGQRVAIGSQNGYLFIFDIHNKQLLFGQKIHLGGVEGMDWSNGRLVTCSSDLCISLIKL